MRETQLSMDTMPPSPGSAAQAVYASFGFDADEYALDVRCVSEVVNLPAAVTTMPLAPDFVKGIFNLRGSIIPLLDARRLLGLREESALTDAKVVVVEHAGVRLGLVVDRTGRVLRPRPEEQALFTYEDNSKYKVVGGVLKIGDALIRVLDLDRLIGLEDVPHTLQQAAGQSRAKVQRRRCIVFRVGQIRLAFPISGIDEIVLATGLESSPVQQDLCEGVLHIRGQVVPVVRFDKVLRTPTAVSALDPDARVIVLAFDQVRVGMLVDAVESIETYVVEELMHVPVVSRHKADMFMGCIDLADRGHVLLLNSASVLDPQELTSITGNFSSLFKKKATAVLERRRSEQRQAFLWFTAREAFALPMAAVREIIDCRAELIAMPGTPDYVAGMVNLRGRLVTVVDVRGFYRLGGLDRTALTQAQRDQHRIVVLDHGEMLLGLLVDSVESIVRVAAEDRIPVPHLVRHSMPEGQREDVLEVVQIRQEDKLLHVRVLEPSRIFSSVAGQV